jgi:ABC-type glycerol-3-phosphate transport system substrate-binding protein
MELKKIFQTRVWIGAILSIALVLSPALTGLADSNGASATDAKKANADIQVSESKPVESYYAQVLEKWKKEGASSEHQAKITIPGSKPASRSDNANVAAGSYQGKNDVLIWSTQRDEWIEYEFEVAQGGLYTLGMSYHPFVGSKNRKPIALNVTIDGANPFLESKSIMLYRQWKDKLPIRKDDRGDEIRPVSEDISGWMTWELRDMTGAYEDPLQWYLTPGKHKLRLAGSDPFALESITLKAPERTADYRTVRAGQPAATAPVHTDAITIQAETVQWKSDSAISLNYDNDIGNVPYEQGKITYNTIDGERWASGNQEISWSLDVPEAGYYKIAMRAQQSFVSNRSSFRQIMINGKVPFSELKAYRFMYSTGWQGIPLADDAGKPFEFYLNKGTNTISMRVTQAPVRPIALELESIIDELRKLFSDVRTLTGGVDDKNRTWELDKDLPGFTDQLRGVSTKLTALMGQLEKINGRPDSVTQGLVTVLKDIETLLKDPDEIPYDAGRLVTLQGTIGEQIKQLSFQPLQLDRIFVVPASQPFPVMEASFMKKIQGGLVNFFLSFKPKGKWGQTEDEDVLNVWMYRGRDYVNLLQGLADEMFTTQTGIKVRINLLKDEKLLVLMNAAGIAPDVVLGLPQDLPFDYAIRSGIYNLKQFPDFDEYYKRFAPGSWTPFYYDGGYYGVPETQTFQIMYYRKDILASLGLQVPDTWDDLYKMLPILQQNGMNFTPVEHNVFLQMHGADYYEQSGAKTALGSEKGFDAFRKWTELQNKYAIDQRMESFYQHFRDGSYPIGIADLNAYIQLSVAAPQLNGLWGVAPVPGVKQPDGTVSRWMGGNMQATTIMKNAKKPNEGWEFVKWWTSPEVQERFGTDLETLNGVTFRWYTSSIDAFVNLPWKEDDIKAIMEQWKWFREVPNVPGSYFMERELRNAWTRTVVNGMHYRTSLETAIKEVDREIYRKLQEFEFIDANGNVVRSLNLPIITKPWEGVDKHVKD